MKRLFKIFLPSIFAIVSLTAMPAALAAGLKTLGGVGLGSSVLTAVHVLGVPSLVQSTDDGHEWRWFDTKGMDIDVLTDDELTVHQVLVSRPEPVDGKVSPLVQPAELPVLESVLPAAEKLLGAAGGQRQTEPENTISAWRLGEDFVVLELAQNHVQKILSLDRASAQRFGYLGSAQPLSHRAPRLLSQAPVDYPKRAIADRAQGVVVVRIDVSLAGYPKDIKIVVSSGNSDLDNAEIQSMRKARFRPARCDGQPCDGVYFDREEFTLD